MKFRKLLLISGLLLATVCVQAQDIHFSQFYMSPTNLNPALTGVMNCNGRFSFNYRSQWQSVLKTNAFNTTSASYDARTPVGRSDFFGYGLTLWGDQAGDLHSVLFKENYLFLIARKWEAIENVRIT